MRNLTFSIKKDDTKEGEMRDIPTHLQVTDLIIIIYFLLTSTEDSFGSLFLRRVREIPYLASLPFVF